MEMKFRTFDEFELKLRADGGGFSGYASVFGGVDSYGDTILPGAFSEDLKSRSRPLALLYEHRTLVGKWTDVGEDNIGLKGKAEFTPGHSIAKDVHALMKHGALDGISIGFMIPKGGAEKTATGRIIKSAVLDHIAVVRSPADNAARVAEVKAQIEAAESLRDIEAYLRDSGLSRGTAQALLSRVKSLILSDSDQGRDEKAEIKSRLLSLAQKPESILRVCK